MPNQFFKTVAMSGLICSGLVSLSALALGRIVWASGVMVGAFWVLLNVFFLFQLFEMSMNLREPKKGRILLLSVLKFPVLYLAGFFILKTRFFPVLSLLTGLTLFFMVLAIRVARANFGGAGMHTKLMQVAGAMLGFSVAGRSAVAWASEAAHHASEAAPHGQAHGSSGGGSLHTTNLVGLLAQIIGGSAGEMLLRFENVIYGALVIFILFFIFYKASSRASLKPGRLQAACEAVVEALTGFVCSILGPQGRKYAPFLGTLFLYILTMNLIGLVPLMKSNTANSITLPGPVPLPVPTTTVALALIVFVYVQSVGIKNLGVIGYLDHMAGTPRDIFGFIMVPLMLPIHLIGELAKPFSLTFRLFCNIMGGHILVAVFIGMAMGAAFIPFQVPFLIFEIATSTIQAFVFTLLSTVYIAMMLPHNNHSHEVAHSH